MQKISTEKILGIDQSLNSTGVCLLTEETFLNDGKIVVKRKYNYWIIASKMTKKMEQFRYKNINIIGYNKRVGEDYESKEAAKTLNIFDICSVIDSIIKKYKPDCICMEGISYGNVGSASLVDLAGLNYCIRMVALNRGLAFHIISPTQLKKEATGNGGAEKEEMVWAWKQCDPTIKDVAEIKIDDLADAFFLATTINK